MDQYIQIADKGARLANFIIDTIAIVFIYTLLAIALYFIYPESIEEPSSAPEILIYTVFILYYFLFEAIAGKTLGKMLTRTKVTNLQGNKPDLPKIFFRTILRLIPVDGFAFLFGPAGLHDLITRTTVISTKKEPAINPVLQ